MNRLQGRWITDPTDNEPLSFVGFEGHNNTVGVFSDLDGGFRKVGIVDVMRWEDELQQQGKLADEYRLTCSNEDCMGWNTAKHVFSWLNIIDLRAA